MDSKRQKDCYSNNFSPNAIFRKELRIKLKNYSFSKNGKHDVPKKSWKRSSTFLKSEKKLKKISKNFNTPQLKLIDKNGMT